ncbi:MAG: hypothetical protein LLF28_00195 [Nitrospiraceae bacterium]|nr:hypothetical protein [Nitrospiraceae bacterium]
MNLKKLLVILFVLLLHSTAFATAQIPDYIVYKGETLSIFSNPLESYFSTKNPRPNSLFVFSCTACWRGYVATWKIEDGYLYLTKISEGTCGSDSKEIPISKIFHEQKAPIKAVWFNGTLRIQQGKLLQYIHMGYGSVYEKELLLTIENGRLIREEIIDNTKKPEQ